jgi:hypothetical protein
MDVIAKKGDVLDSIATLVLNFNLASGEPLGFVVGLLWKYGHDI